MDNTIPPKDEYTISHISRMFPRLMISYYAIAFLALLALAFFAIIEKTHSIPDYPIKIIYLKTAVLLCLLILGLMAFVFMSLAGTKLFQIFDKYPRAAVNSQTIKLLIDMVCGSQGMLGVPCKMTAMQYVPALLENITTYEFLQTSVEKRKKLYKELRSDNSVLIKSILNLLDRCNDPLAIPELELFTASNSRKVNNPEIVSHAQSCLKMIESA